MFSLQDKRILITGASRGLGSVCARAFAQSGARLALMARSDDALEAVRASCDRSDHHLVTSVDLTDEVVLNEAVQEAIEFLGQIDVVLHIAGGGLGLREPLISSGDLSRLFALNVGAAVEINRLVAPAMIERGEGNLVHVASVAATDAVASVGYNTVKAAPVTHRKIPSN